MNTADLLLKDAAQVVATERAVIGALIAEASQAETPPLLPDDFSTGRHRIIWAAIRALKEKGLGVDLTSVSQELAAEGLLDQAGGERHLGLCLAEGCSAVHVKTYAHQIRESRRRREVKSIEVRRKGGDMTPEELDAARSVIPGPLYGSVVISKFRVDEMADGTSEPVSWLWPDRIAIGKLNLILGLPGMGKSLVTLDLAARLSMGREMPDGSPPITISNTIILSAEDGTLDTIKPRLEAHGADCSRVARAVAIEERRGEREFSLKMDLPALEALIIRKGAKLVILDPLAAYTDSDNGWDDAAMRRLLTPLAAMAERLKVAIVGIMHFTKAGDRPLIHRVPGSIAIAAAARSILVALPDPEDDGRKVLSSLKNQFGPKPPSLAYRLSSGAITWEKDPVVGFDVEMVAASKPADSYAVREAVEFLTAQFEDKKPGEWVPCKPILEQAKAGAISGPTLRRAAKKLGVVVRRIGGAGAKGAWYWGKPSTTPENHTPPGNTVEINALDGIDALADGEDAKASKKSKKSIKSLIRGSENSDALIPGDLLIRVTPNRLLDGMLRAPSRPVHSEPCTFKDCPVHTTVAPTAKWSGGFTDWTEDPHDLRNDREQGGES